MSVLIDCLIYFTVNSVCFAPHELGLMLACGSSDGSISILTSAGKEAYNIKFRKNFELDAEFCFCWFCRKACDKCDQRFSR